jgi:hypothetical protein
LIVARLEADHRIGNPYIWLLTIVGNGDGDSFLQRMRRDLDAPDAGDDPRPPPKPPWCGECDEQTRMVTVLGETPAKDRMARCLRCHPLSQAPP